MRWWQHRTEARDDAVFGRIMRDRHGWNVERSASESDGPLFSLVAGDDGPTEAQREAHRQLQGQLIQYDSELTAALYELYASYLALPDWDGPRPGTAEDLRSMLELSSVRYLADGTPELLFAFEGEAWPDAMFTVEIRDGRVRGLSLDD